MANIRSGPPRHRGRGVLAIVASAALVVSGVIGANLSSTAQAAPPDANTANIVDIDATAETKSLWAYLEGTRGEGILFGHQGDLDNGVTFSTADGTKSDVHAGTGDYPAVFGIDTLSLEGSVSPGKPTNTDAQNVTAVAEGIKQADRRGGIVTFSTHINNFATGGSFSDPNGRVVSHILPGGDKHAVFNAYLDRIAGVADQSVNDDGKKIPIILRPFHENTGSWFWWGAAHATPGEYKELFRYTVEYLRDTKGVSNFLYAFSPNGTLGGDSSQYLATYPGDAWVDIMGYDNYESNDAPADSKAWIEGTLVDLRMLSDLADEHGKIAAFTEFGRNGERTIQETGNKSLNYYTDLLTAMKNDPKAKKMAYMLTWQNWGMDQFYVPYPAFGSTPEHEMYPDFKAMYDDPYSVFASNIPADALTRDISAAPAQPTLRLVSPADGVRVTTPSTTVRAKATVDEPKRVWFTVAGDAAEHELTLGADGYYSALWDIGEDGLTNVTVKVTVHATYAVVGPKETTVSIILGDVAELPVGVIDNFEGYGDDDALRAGYTVNNAPAATLTLGAGANGSQGASFAYDFTAREYQGFSKILKGGQDWSAFNRMNLWLDPDGSDQKLVLQMKAGGQTFEAYPSLAGTDAKELAIHFNDFRPPPWDSANASKRLTLQSLKSVSEFSVFINGTETFTTPGSINVDDIRAVAGEGGAVHGGTTPTATPTVTTPPSSALGIDDFESYADDAAVQSAWNRRNDQKDLSLVAPLSGTGTQAMQFAYDFSKVNYAGVGRSLEADWSGYAAIRGWVMPDGSDRGLLMQFKAGGVSWDIQTSLTGTKPVQILLALADAVPAGYQNLDPDRRPTVEELTSVTEFVIFLFQGSGGLTSGAIVLDDLHVAGPREPEPTPTATSSPTATASPTGTMTIVPTATATATVTVTATPPSGGDVYTTPGYHSLNGRKWFTTCEPYSATWRCTTQIWSIQVTQKGGTFEKATGWFFNNLTYLPVKRATWAGNPLGNTGAWTSTDGRQWRTECDTAVTGGNGCRSYIRLSVVQATQRPGGGYSYAMAKTWVFNNIVLFS